MSVCVKLNDVIEQRKCHPAIASHRLRSPLLITSPARIHQTAHNALICRLKQFNREEQIKRLGAEMVLIKSKRNKNKPNSGSLLVPEYKMGPKT